MTPLLLLATALGMSAVLPAQTLSNVTGDRKPDLGAGQAMHTTPLALLGVALPSRVELRLSDAPPNALVAAVIGFQRATVPLPGGAVLGLEPLYVPTISLANAFGRADLSWQFPLAGGSGLRFLASAIALDTSIPWGSVGALRVASELPLQVPVAGSYADLILLFGQSNAEGFAPLAELPLSLQGPLPLLRVWNDVANTWQALHAGRNNQLFPDVPRFGPEMGFAVAANSATTPLWLVKFAVSQSSLGPMPGPWNEWGPAAGELYPEFLRRIEAAVKGIHSLGLVPQIRLICMMQGETDAMDAAAATAYGARLLDLVASLRADLASRQLVGNGPAACRIGLVSPRLPTSVFGYSDQVRAGQQIAAAGLPNCEVVETKDLQLHADGVHFAAGGLLGLGRLFATGLRR